MTASQGGPQEEGELSGSLLRWQPGQQVRLAGDRLHAIGDGCRTFLLAKNIKRVIDGGETNYISATLSIYLSIYNVFQSLLAILGIAGGERE